MINPTSFNVLRKNAGYAGSITVDELKTLGSNPLIFRTTLGGGSLVVIRKETLDGYRKQAGYVGEMTNAERDRAAVECSRASQNVPSEVPRVTPSARVTA